MPNSTCKQCMSCLEHFCETCDLWANCPGCGEPQCEECHLDANTDDERNGLCFECCEQPYDDRVMFHGQDKRLCKNNHQLIRGKLK